MKPEMDDVELAQLELRLRKSVVGHAPAAPDALVRFIDTVPVTEPAARRLSLVHARPGVRRAFFALAAAAVLVVAVAGTAALVTIRNEQSRGVPAAGDGWSWQRADGTLVSVSGQVAHGFVGICTSGSGSESLCSSGDGSTWAVPADPAIVSVDGPDQFWPGLIVRSGGVYLTIGSTPFCNSTGDCLASSAATPTPVSSRQLWRSTDGLHWSRIDSPALAGLVGDNLGMVAGAFVALVQTSEGTGTGSVLTSVDGLTWSTASQLPVRPDSFILEALSGSPAVSEPGTAGLCVGQLPSSGSVEWRSLDAKTWARVTLPPGIQFACGGRTSDGTYLGTGIEGSVGLSTVNGGRIVRSSDGLTWRVDQGNLPGYLLDMVSVGNRLVAEVVDSPVSPLASTTGASIWESADLGHTWQPLLDATGKQLHGRVRHLGDRVAFYSGSDRLISWGRLEWLGSRDDTQPVESPSATPSSTPSASHSTSPSRPEPTPPVTPSLGISQADAIRIAAQEASATQEEIAGASAMVVYGDLWWADAKDYRWVWKVIFTTVAGPTSGRQATVIIDYLTGSVITVRDLYA